MSRKVTRRVAAPGPVSAESRNLRGLRIAHGPTGLATLYRAALSQAAIRALCHQASSVSGGAGAYWPSPKPLVFTPDRAPRYAPATRLYALASALASMRAAGVRPSDTRWGLGTVDLQAQRLSGIPVLQQEGGPAFPAQDVVRRALTDVPAHDGVSALTVVIEAANLPEPVECNQHPQPLLPYRLANAVSTPSVPLSLSGPGPVGVGDLDVSVLPNLLPAGVDTPVLPLPLYNLLTVRQDRRRGGYSADLALRIFVEAVTSIMQQDWESATCFPVSVTITLREFLAWFYGSNRSRWPAPVRYWPRFMAAAEALDRVEARFPYDFGGHSGLRRVVSLGNIPRGPGHLDDDVTILVHLPPGSTGGPAIDRLAMRRWGLRSEVAYRTLLGLHYHWYQPGRTRFPKPGGRWVQSQDPERYRPFTPDGLVSLCYPSSAVRRRRVLLHRAWKCIRSLEAAGALRVCPGSRILPPLPDSGAAVVEVT